MFDGFSTLAAGREIPTDAASELQERGFVVLPGPVPSERMEWLFNAYTAAVASATDDDIRIGSTSTRVNDWDRLRGPHATRDASTTQPTRAVCASALTIGMPCRLLGVRLQWPQEVAMSTVSTRVLKDQLSSYLQRAEAGEQIVVLRDGHPVAALVPLSQLRDMDEQARLAEMAARGLVALPNRTTGTAFQGPALPNRGKLASEMILEDRR
jgi:prevent-host-death family protein